MVRVSCIYCNREREAPPDTHYYECCVCVMKRMKARVKMSFPPEEVAEFLNDKGWSWRDLSRAAGISYPKVLDYKNGEGECPVELQRWLNENV